MSPASFPVPRHSGFTSTAMAYPVGRAGMHPLRQRQYSDSPPYILGHHWAEPRFSRPVVKKGKEGTKPQAELRGKHVAASDAQATQRQQVDTSPGRVGARRQPTVKMVEE